MLRPLSTIVSDDGESTLGDGHIVDSVRFYTDSSRPICRRVPA